MTKSFVFIGGLAVGLVGFLLGAMFFAAQPNPAYGASDIIGLNTIQTSTSVWVGKDLDTTVAATNTARVLLRIGNISGATTTSQALYCNVNGAPATIYSGYVVQASSSEEFAADTHLYRGALHCRFPVASSTVTLIEQ